MIIIYIYMVTSACIGLGNSFGSTKSQSPSEERYNFFDAELLQIFNRKEETNVLISPISIKLLLGMLLEGAEEKTADEIRSALRLPIDEEERRKEFNTWLSALQVKDSPNILKIANRIFLSDRYSINHIYGKALRKYYSGGVTSVKFEETHEASSMINNWVANQTSRLIPSIVDEDQISSDCKLMLLSAVYFKGIWSRPFASGRTAIRCFYTKDNKCKDSLMMMETGYFDYGYISRLDAKAISLPYKGGTFSMLLILPSRRDGIKLLTRDMSHVSLPSILSELKEEEIFVQIPQFEISYNDDLVEGLKSIQVSELFTGSANLSKMFTSGLETASVSHFYHSAKITVNEEGSEGAAATGAMFVPLMGGTTTSFVANHPFLFFVINSANSILFAGKVAFPHSSSDFKKNSFSLTPHNAPTKKTVLKGNLVISNQKNNTAPKNSSGGETNPLERNFQETKHGHRGQNPGPKFRSIKPAFSLPHGSSNEKATDFRANLEGSLLSSPVRRGLISLPGDFFERDSPKKRGKTAQDPSKGRKRQEKSEDDWRRHVLIFT